MTQIWKDNGEFAEIGPVDSRQMLVLSLGTGTDKEEERYDAAEASKWGMVSWLYDGGRTPLLHFFADASSDMVDFHVSTFFHCLDSKENYLRIQVAMIFFFFFGSLWKCLVGMMIRTLARFEPSHVRNQT